MTYVSKVIEFSPVWGNREKVNKCVEDMRKEGYELNSKTDMGIAWTIRVFVNRS